MPSLHQNKNYSNTLNCITENITLQLACTYTIDSVVFKVIPLERKTMLIYRHLSISIFMWFIFGWFIIQSTSLDVTKLKGNPFSTTNFVKLTSFAVYMSNPSAQCYCTPVLMGSCVRAAGQLPNHQSVQF